MFVTLLFGSSARRGATGWTDRARVRWVIDTSQPDLVVDGASPSDYDDHGADRMVYEEAVAAGIATQRCPMDRALDGSGGAAFLRRNARMYRTHKPSLAAGFISGNVGTPLSSGSAHMAGICLRGLPEVPSCAVAVYRDDGVEPYDDLAMALAQLRRLHAATKDPALVAPGKALASLCECGEPPADEVLAALRYARDGSRWAPWLDAAIATVGLVS